MKSLIRCSGLLMLAILGAVLLAVTAPQQLLLIAYKLTLIPAAGYAGYWVDRHVFPYGRPDQMHIGNESPSEINAAMLRRAIIVAAAIIGVSIGL